MTASKSRSDRSALEVVVVDDVDVRAEHGVDESRVDVDLPSRIDRSDDARAARDTAFRLLAQREHSTDELRRKLKKRGYAAVTITAVVESLDAAHSVSDARFAESFVRVRSERGQGPLKIRAELRERGVTDGVVDEVMTATADFWLERADKARSKRFGSALPSDRDAWNRQARFLAQRGYPADLIYRTLGAVRR